MRIGSAWNFVQDTCYVFLAVTILWLKALMRPFRHAWPRKRLNTNRVKTKGFSNIESERLHSQRGRSDLSQDEIYLQCGGCSFYAAFNQDYGLCCNPSSRHLTETVFEHFTCPSYVDEGWGPHSFTADTTFHCKCQGTSVYEMMKYIIFLLDREGLDDELRSHLRALRQWVENNQKDRTS